MSVIKFLSISPAHTTDVPAIIIIIKKSIILLTTVWECLWNQVNIAGAAYYPLHSNIWHLDVQTHNLNNEKCHVPTTVWSY